MKFEVRIEPPARRDLEAVVLWIAKDSEPDAKIWYERVRRAIESLADMPHRARLAPENREFESEIRQLIHGRRSGSYRILFTIREGTVHVLHIRHAARLPLRENR